MAFTFIPSNDGDQKSYEILASTAAALNAATNRLNQSVIELEEILKKLGIGISSWVTFAKIEFNDGMCYDYDQVGYAKLGGRWGLAIRNVVGNEVDDNPDKIEAWTFNESPRHLRVQAVEKIPALLQKIITDATEFTKKVDSSANEVRSFSRAIADGLAATSKPADILPVKPPSSGGGLITTNGSVTDRSSKSASGSNSVGVRSGHTLYGTKATK